MKRRIISIAVAAMCSPALALAQSASNTQPSMVSFSGFGTVGYVQTDTSEGQFPGASQPNGATKTGSFEIDSVLGAQANVKFASNFSSVVQVVSRKGADSSARPTLEWAFAKFSPTNAVSIRAGRMGAPLFMVSDYRVVGYANTWVRPPTDVYSQVNFRNFDGADILWRTSLGGANVNAQVFYGTSESKLPFGGQPVTIKVKSFGGVNVTIESGAVSVRAGHVQGKLNVPTVGGLATVVGTLRAVGFAARAAELEANNKPASFSGLGITYDEGNVLALAEYTKRRTDSFVADTTGWYATFGYRVGKFTPYATVSRIKVDSPMRDTTVPRVGPLAAIAAGIDGLLSSNSQHTNAIGVRYDGFKSVALKAQYERIDAKQGTTGYFISTTPRFTSPNNVLSLTADFVF